MSDEEDSPARPRGVYWLPNLLTTGAVLKTTDGGTTWTLQETNSPGNNFNGVTVARDSNNAAWIVGEGGAIQTNTPVHNSCRGDA